MPYISAGYANSLRNMFVPFPHRYEQIKARFLADARNALVQHAIDAGFDYVLQIDADQWFPPEFFVTLWEGIKRYGDDAVVTGWSICKAGKYAKQPSVYRVADGDIVAITTAELRHREEYIEVDAFGTCGFLASTKLLRKLRSPWFADINLIRDDLRVDGLLVATEFAMGQDLSFATRIKEVGGRLICATKMRMPHEEVTVL